LGCLRDSPSVLSDGFHSLTAVDEPFLVVLPLLSAAFGARLQILSSFSLSRHR